MRIAVTYENGQVFQHFGHTEEFKIYEVEDGKVTGTEIIGSTDTYSKSAPDLCQKPFPDGRKCLISVPDQIKPRL